MFLTYTEYRAMGGQLSEAEFNRYEFRARSLINELTHQRIRDESPVRECVKMSAFDLIGQMKGHDSSMGGDSVAYASMSNDGVSVTYADRAKARRNANKELEQTLTLYLADEVDARGVPLLYGGVEYDTLRP